MILELIESDFSSSILLALLKNPLCFYSNNKEILSDFEVSILRKDRSKSGLAGIKDKLEVLEKDDLSKFFQDFLQDISLLTNIPSKVILADYLDALIIVIGLLSIAFVISINNFFNLRKVTSLVTQKKIHQNG